MNNIIVAIVGMCGTGKSEAAKYIEQTYKFKSVYFGGYVLKEVKKRNLEINANNENGFDEQLQRAVKENCSHLKFENCEFEE